MKMRKKKLPIGIENFEDMIKEELKQIEHTRYEDDLLDDGVENILKYGIACYKKQCKVILAGQ